MNLSGKLSLPAGVVACFFLGACGQHAPVPNESVQHHEVRGVVRSLPPDQKTIDVEHEDIPGFMPSMTMPFLLRDEKEIAPLQIGDAIAFRLNLTERDSWIDQVRKIDPAQVHLPTPSPTVRPVKSARLHDGDLMPAFQLVDQTGQPINLATFHGHPFVLTFIFTRCPIPNFCPRMTQDFAELQQAIRGASSEPLVSTKLLSISFDPEHDNPAVLADYARAEKSDPAVWKFATGDSAEISRLTTAFSVLVQPGGGSISHSLATALVDGDGRIEKIWRGNGWTREEVLQQISR